MPLPRVLYRALLATLLILPAAAAQAEVAPPTGEDALLFWRNVQLHGPANGARHDVNLYFIKHWWFRPNWGLYAFYGTVGTATLRLQHKLAFGGGEQPDGTKLPPAATLTLMLGGRAAGIGGSLATFSAGMREGPEAAVVLGVPLGAGLTWSVNGSFAHLWNFNGRPAAALAFYGSNLVIPLEPTTSLSVGVLGAFMGEYGAPLSFHDLGPTLTVGHKF